MANTQPRDLLLDPVTGDLVIAKSDLQLAVSLTATAQAATIRVKTLLGEWFLDDPANPVVGLVDIENIDQQMLDQAGFLVSCRAVLASTPGVLQIISVTLTPNQEASPPTMNVVASLQCTDGPLNLTVPTQFPT